MPRRNSDVIYGDFLDLGINPGSGQFVMIEDRYSFNAERFSKNESKNNHDKTFKILFKALIKMWIIKSKKNEYIAQGDIKDFGNG
jgi:hypothetical protein